VDLSADEGSILDPGALTRRPAAARRCGSGSAATAPRCPSSGTAPCPARPGRRTPAGSQKGTKLGNVGERCACYMADSVSWHYAHSTLHTACFRRLKQCSQLPHLHVLVLPPIVGCNAANPVAQHPLCRGVSRPLQGRRRWALCRRRRRRQLDGRREATMRRRRSPGSRRRLLGSWRGRTAFWG
jgi:hypothetical protein